MDIKKISIIVPIYNVEKYLNRCIDSIINQTYKNLEIILVDDGSPDNCGKICDEYAKKDNRIKVVHKENGGVSSARNAGLDIVTGDYIGFVDGDDYIKFNMYEKLLNSAIKYNSDIAFCNSEIHYNNEIIPSNFNNHLMCYNTSEFIIDIMIGGGQRSACLAIYKKDLIDGIYFDEKIYFSEDYFFNYNIAKKSQLIINIGEDLYCYCRRNSSVTKTYNYETCKNRMNIAVEIYNEEKNNNELRPYALKGILDEIFCSINIVLKNNDYNKFWELRNMEKKYIKLILKSDFLNLKYKIRCLYLYYLPNIYMNRRIKQIKKKE